MFFQRLILTMLLLLGSTQGSSLYWVFFAPSPDQTQVVLTSKAQQRLLERGTSQPLGNQAVSAQNLAQLRAAGFRIRHTSRFLNAASIIVTEPADLARLRSLDCIAVLRPVASRSDLQPEFVADQALPKAEALGYGPSFAQNELLHIPAIHQLGFTGSGVTIGVFDTGFLTDLPVFDELNILDQYDFVDHEPDVTGVGHGHGTSVLSALGGYFIGELIGPAYAADFLLARTEDVNSESRVEEDNWVAALEWADSLGVDIISSSLNYRLEHNDPAEDYPDSAIDGETTIITRAANIAAERGILVVNSVANEGPAAASVWPPADSRHVLAVGAVNSRGELAAWSSRGPTYDGRLKPDVIAQGVQVAIASATGSFTQGNGTSFATPVLAGLAALLLQAHPALTPDSIITLFHENGDRALSPDNGYGYGLPDLRSFFQPRQTGVKQASLIYPNPSSVQQVQMVLPDPVARYASRGSLFNMRGQLMAELSVHMVSETIVALTLPTDQVLADQLLILTVSAGQQVFLGKLVYLRAE